MIHAANLVKRFGTFTAVDDVSFTVQTGEVLGFLGPNGAGKSTTMRMLTGFLQADEGEVRIGAYDMDRRPIDAKALIGYLPESAPLYGDMTVDGFLSFTAALRGLRGRDRRRAVDAAVEACFLEPVRQQSVDTLSKGYRHRTCFAQAILHDPPVLVMDEPTDGLDPNQKHEIRNLIKRMGERKAIILSTHILEEVDAVCSRVLLIHRGRLVANGLPGELRARSALAGAVTLAVPSQTPAALAARLGTLAAVARTEAIGPQDAPGGMLRLYPTRPDAADGAPAPLAPLLAAACGEAGWAPSELHTEPGRLDDVFRAITTSEGEYRT